MLESVRKACSTLSIGALSSLSPLPSSGSSNSCACSQASFCALAARSTLQPGACPIPQSVRPSGGGVEPTPWGNSTLSLGRCALGMCARSAASMAPKSDCNAKMWMLRTRSKPKSASSGICCSVQGTKRALSGLHDGLTSQPANMTRAWRSASTPEGSKRMLSTIGCCALRVSRNRTTPSGFSGGGSNFFLSTASINPSSTCLSTRLPPSMSFPLTARATSEIDSACNDSAGCALTVASRTSAPAKAWQFIA
mmetsp:Transcript_124304/g.310738  ORF Transcript_124304/g.310738 Transcript_124304/m.310738 type:complete len:252 (-) Transcript_124304:1480-2235(-)